LDTPFLSWKEKLDESFQFSQNQFILILIAELEQLLKKVLVCVKVVLVLKNEKALS
jgi:hypothetical protein